MRKSVKTLVLLTTFFCLFTNLQAQLKLPGAGAFGSDFKKIFSDYSSHFSHYTGELLVENAQSADYSCNCEVSGAEEMVITRYSAKAGNIYSWQAVMLTTDDFDKARQKFKSLFTQLNNLAVQPAGTDNFHLKGSYEAPSMEKKFTSIVFSLSPKDESVKKIKAELSLEFYEPMEWKVKVIIYDRDREDNERGRIRE